MLEMDKRIKSNTFHLPHFMGIHTFSFVNIPPRTNQNNEWNGNILIGRAIPHMIIINNMSLLIL